MKKIKSLLLASLFVISSLTCALTASAETITDDDTAYIYVTDVESEHATDYPTPETPTSPALTAKVGDIIEVTVTATPTTDIVKFAGFWMTTYFGQSAPGMHDDAIEDNALELTGAYYDDGMLSQPAYDNGTSVVTHPDPFATSSDSDYYAYTVSSAYNICNYSKPRAMYTFTLEVKKPGSTYINTTEHEIIIFNENNKPVSNTELLDTKTSVAVVGHIDTPTEPTTVETEPVTTEPITEPVTTEPITDPIVTEPTTEPITTETVTEPTEETPTVPVTESVTSEPYVEPTIIVTEPVTTEPVTEPTEETSTAPVTEPVTEPTEITTTEPVTVPTTTESATDPTEDRPTVSVTEPVTNEPETEETTVSETTEPATEDTTNVSDTTKPDTTAPTESKPVNSETNDTKPTTNTATKDTAVISGGNSSNNSSGAIATGQIVPIAIILIAMISAGVFAVFTRKKYTDK